MTLRDLLRSVRRVELRTTRRVNDMMVGAWASRFKGRGMDFEELREYLPGDDVRHIDWNVTRRMRRPYVRMYREERELTCVLAVDVSASTSLGATARSTREFAAELAATLAFSAARNGDKVGLLLFSRSTELYLPPRKGRRHLLRLVRETLAFPPHDTGTHVGGALAFLNRILPRRAVVFLLTDLLHLEASGASRGAFVRQLGLTCARHDVVCVHLADPGTTRLPAAGLLTVEDVETGEVHEIDTMPLRVREAIARTASERLISLDRTLRHAGADTLRLDPSASFAQPLQRFLESRRVRRR